MSVKETNLASKKDLIKIHKASFRADSPSQVYGVGLGQGLGFRV